MLRPYFLTLLDGMLADGGKGSGESFGIHCEVLGRVDASLEAAQALIRRYRMPTSRDIVQDCVDGVLEL